MYAYGFLGANGARGFITILLPHVTRASIELFPVGHLWCLVVLLMHRKLINILRSASTSKIRFVVVRTYFYWPERYIRQESHDGTFADFKA